MRSRSRQQLSCRQPRTHDARSRRDRLRLLRYRELPHGRGPHRSRAVRLRIGRPRCRRRAAGLDERLRPDGYNLIWNVGEAGGQSVEHVHLQLIPRFADEPFAGRGGRSWLKQPENRRPDPSAPGSAAAR
ncbi:MAG: HIT domain-containing protein [Acidimicrobiia bacterium]|nr:HIT domain-containing protein [Acidimicrobiia bacterium]